MELLIFFLLTFIAATILLGFWVRNLIRKLLKVADERAKFYKLTYILSEEFIEALQNPYYSGDPNLQELRDMMDKFVKYIQSDQIYEEVKFLYEEENS